MSMNCFEMYNISLVFFGFQVLNKVDFIFYGGLVYVLIGVNGVGKLMLMVVLCGIYVYYEGEVMINNLLVIICLLWDVKQLGIYLVQQEVDVVLVLGLSIVENIMLDRLVELGMIFCWLWVWQLVCEVLVQLDVVLDVWCFIDSCMFVEKQ